MLKLQANRDRLKLQQIVAEFKRESSLINDQTKMYIHNLLAQVIKAGGSDLFIANNFPPSMKVDGDAAIVR